MAFRVRGPFNQKLRVLATCERFIDGRACPLGGNTALTPIFRTMARYETDGGGASFGVPGIFTQEGRSVRRSHRDQDGSYRWRLNWTGLLRRVGVEDINYSFIPKTPGSPLYSARYECGGGSGGSCRFVRDND